ncbi:MAG: response regulator [Desulfobacteraceae bacterium]|jgi:PAS domain S-box-containing protein
MTSRPDKNKILIVDDQPDNIWSLAQHLQSEFDVLCSISGEEALEIAFFEKRPDLILLDIMMPGMDGFQVFEKLKADDRTKEIPVIFLTGKTADSEQVKGLDLGAQDYITKPFSMPVVTARIKSVLNLKKEMNRRLLLRAQLENLNQQLERQVRQKRRELETARQALKQYEDKWHILFDKRVAQQEPRRILVVDDEPDNIHVLVKNLQSQYEIIYATSGKEALEIAFSDYQPNLILLDIMMPDMDGFEVCSRLKANTDTWDIPVIFVTTLDKEVDETKGLNLGAVDFVTKPFNIPVVKARVKAALRLKDEMEHRITLARKLEELNKNLETRIREKAAALEQAHEDLKVSERKYRSIYENATEGVFQITSEGRLLDANPSFAKILGYESSRELVATITNAAHQLYFRPQDRDEFIQTLEQKGEIVGFETQFKKKGGDVIWAMICAKTIRDENSEILYFQGFTIDITERKQAEAELRKHRDHLEELVKERTYELEVANKGLEAQAIELAAAKEQALEAQRAAEEANQFKSEFLARMSHEIRTPLNAVTGLTNIVLKTDLTDEQRDYLNKVQLAEGNLLQVINDILDFSKVEAGRLELAYAPFDLDQVMEQLADLFSNRVAKKDLQLIFDMPPDVPRQLTGDAGRLTQVLTNLIENAVKFTDSGEIIVGAKPEDDEAEKIPMKTALKFFVSDTGSGIAPDVLPTLFDPFTQVDSSLSRKYEGTGLGLAICRRLVELMGGRIWAESTPGRGSTFSFTAMLETRMELAEAMAPRRAQEPAELPIRRLAGHRVLVVEDSELNLDVAVALLEETGLTVETAENGRRAVDKVTGSEPEYYDAVFMDIQMPIMDGYEATRRIRAWEYKFQHESTDFSTNRPPVTGHRIPIIALTAHAIKGEKEKCLAADMDDYLSKPLDEEYLRRMLLKWIVSRQEEAIS